MGGGSGYIADQVLLQVRDASSIDAAVSAIGGTSWKASSLAGWYLVTLADGVSADEAIARGQGNPLIETVEHNYTAVAVSGDATGTPAPPIP